MAQLRTQHGLTDDEITDIILKYIDEEIYNYAIMIDGEWGCGKTYVYKVYSRVKNGVYRGQKPAIQQVDFQQKKNLK